jgi:hypothetical protein
MLWVGPGTKIAGHKHKANQKDSVDSGLLYRTTGEIGTKRLRKNHSELQRYYF